MRWSMNLKPSFCLLNLNHHHLPPMHFLSLPAALSLYFFLLWLLQLLQPFLIDDFCSPSSSFLLGASSACDMAPSDLMSIYGTGGLPGNYPNNSFGNYPNKISGNYPINNLPDKYPTDCLSMHYPLMTGLYICLMPLSLVS